MPQPVEPLFAVLGPLAVTGTDGAVAPLPPGRRRTLLAALLRSRNRWVDNDTLAAALWERADYPSSISGSIKTYIHQLRKILPEGVDGEARLAGRGGAYRLTVADGELDADVFAALVEAGVAALGRDDPAEAARLQQRALALWRGEPEEDALDTVTVRHLAELRWTARCSLADALIASGEPGEAIALARAMLTEDRLREPAWERLVVAQRAAGWQVDALASYEAARMLLLDTFGAEPGSRLREVYRALLSETAEQPRRPPAGPVPAASVSRAAQAPAGFDSGGAGVPGAVPAGFDSRGAGVPGVVPAGSDSGGAGVPGAVPAGSDSGGAGVPGAVPAGSDSGGAGVPGAVPGGSDSRAVAVPAAPPRWPVPAAPPRRPVTARGRRVSAGLLALVVAGVLVLAGGSATVAGRGFQGAGGGAGGVAAAPRILFGLGPDPAQADKSPLMQSGIGMVSTWYHKQSNLDQFEGWRADVIPRVYASGRALHVIVGTWEDGESVETRFGRACGQPYPLSDEFVPDMQRLAAAFAGRADGPPLYVSMFSGLQKLACADNGYLDDAATTNYYLALKERYFEVMRVMRAAAPNLRIGLNWDGWTASDDIPEQGAGRSMFQYFVEAMRASDFQSFGAFVKEGNAKHIVQMVDALGEHGPVMVSHYGPHEDSLTVYLDDLHRTFTPETLAQLVANGLFAFSFKDPDLQRESPELMTLTSGIVQDYGQFPPAR
ncbi:DNA-binding SARP family transcriptional activator [Catenuloplanes nepalensis]|uniref:DNA-binding SARP family transcriptional activator n=1 Tax=Catenuloplanes nepalensis TaxID=587533 RepID=A0ABT9MPI8_9ACTN|nr:BTAD domain-containing putative transcriptional regulator [Catenuloplanes nepalensis]MDP9793322.1 DNA-binding SARP family transcriptional activator [Catenuloplanes nepalensis]